MTALLRQLDATLRARQVDLRTWARERLGHQWRHAKHLEPLYDLFERAECETVRALVSMPPGAAKTTTIAAGISWLLCRTPGDVHGYVSYSGPATRSKSSLIRDWSEAGGLVPHKEFWSLAEWRSVIGGGLLASGVGGRLTGDRISGVLGVDDPFKNPIQARSLPEQIRRIEWMNAVAWTRLVPSTGSMIVCHTRWDPGDMIGRLRKVVDLAGRPLWEEHVIAAITATGESYWPEVYSLDELILRKLQLDAETPGFWEALYLQAPIQRGGKLFYGEPAGYLPIDRLLIREEKRTIIGVDVAVSVKQSADQSAAVITDNFGTGIETVTDVREVQTWRAESPVTIERLNAIHLAHPGSWLAFEASGVGKPVMQHYKKEFPRLASKVIEVNRVNDKATAAIGTAAAYRQNRVRYPVAAPWRKAHLGRLHNFTGAPGGDDDDVDALINAREAAVRDSGGASSGSISL